MDAFIEKFKTQFEPGSSVTVARAPGRLDVMGGIADYSGSLVLQRPIAEATFAAIQVTDQPVLHVVSGERNFESELEPVSYDEARRSSSDSWTAYGSGVVPALM